MKTLRRTAWRMLLELILGGLVFAHAAAAQTPAPSASTPPANPLPAAAPSTTPIDIRPVLNLNGPWHFEIGDDLEWAETAFDDSKWQPVSLNDSLSAQGFETYTGYGWYRLRIDPQQLAPFANAASSGGLELLITSNSLGQLDVFVNGSEAGHTRGMTEQPSMYQSPPFVVPLGGLDLKHPIVIAVRSWAGPPVTVSRGLLDKAELGMHEDIADRLAVAVGQQWNERVIAGIVITFLFLCVALLGAALYSAQRHHSEYLWLALLCLSVVAAGSVDVSFGLAQIPKSLDHILSMWASRIFMAVTLEFVLRFTATPPSRSVRGVQIALLVLPLISIVGWDQLYDVVSVTAEIVFLALVCVLLFRSWRRGRQEAGVMLLPFFLAAIADSADTIFDYAAGKHWLPQEFASHRFHFGPIAFSTSAVAFAIFLVSLVAVILYRFVRVSEVEQRSTAEIAAAPPRGWFQIALHAAAPASANRIASRCKRYPGSCPCGSSMARLSNVQAPL
jgi:hypothetical protein